VVPARTEALVEKHRAEEARWSWEEQFQFAFASSSVEGGGIGRRSHGDGDSEVEGGAKSVGGRASRNEQEVRDNRKTTTTNDGFSVQGCRGPAGSFSDSPRKRKETPGREKAPPNSAANNDGSDDVVVVVLRHQDGVRRRRR